MTKDTSTLLQYYREYEKTQIYQDLLKDSIEKIRSIEDGSKILVGFSGGKDSCVVLDMLLRYSKENCEIIIYHLDWGYYMDRDIEYEILDNLGIILENYNERRFKLKKYNHNIVKNENGKYEASDKLFFTKFQEVAREERVDIIVSALRKEEGTKRKNVLTEQTKFLGKYNLHLIPHWKEVEVWTYIYTKNVPFLSWYERYGKRIGVFNTEGETKSMAETDWDWWRLYNN